MDKKQTMQRMCALTDRVATEVFDNVMAADCFCGHNPFFGHQVTDDEVVCFIENAVDAAMRKRRK